MNAGSMGSIVFLISGLSMTITTSWGCFLRRIAAFSRETIGCVMVWTWLIALASITGAVANIYRQRWCFWIWLLTNSGYAKSPQPPRRGHSPTRLTSCGTSGGAQHCVPLVIKQSPCREVAGPLMEYIQSERYRILRGPSQRSFIGAIGPDRAHGPARSAPCVRLRVAL